MFEYLLGAKIKQLLSFGVQMSIYCSLNGIMLHKNKTNTYYSLNGIMLQKNKTNFSGIIWNHKVLFYILRDFLRESHQYLIHFGMIRLEIQNLVKNFSNS